MPIAATASLAGRWTRMPRSMRLTMLILVLSIAIGSVMMIWARWSLNSLLSVRPAPEFRVSMETSSGDCGTPALYFVPRAAGSRTDYRLLVDILGGANRYADLDGAGSATPVLFLPAERKPGVGLGRGLVESCDAMQLTITGPFKAAEPGGAFAEVGEVRMDTMSHVTAAAAEPGEIHLTYKRTQNPKPGDALLAVLLSDIDDRWQFGHKRMVFSNVGAAAVNVFFYQEEEFLFLNDTLNPIRPPNVRRAYVDMHLESGTSEGVSANVADVVRQRPTAGLELQNELITISTIFGIGVSLFVEGVLILLISLAAGMAHGAGGSHQTQSGNTS